MNFLQTIHKSVKNQFPTVSVIIPYFGNSLLELEHCIWCVQSQEYPAQNVQIVVIDNNREPVLGDQILLKDRVQLFHEPVAGSYSARNRGIRASSGSILAFTDADCAPSSTWLSNGVCDLAALNFDAVIGGEIVFTFRRASPNIWELYDSMIHLRQEEYVKNNHFAATANLIASRQLFAKVGLFNEAFYSGGDRDWGLRVTAKRVPIVYSRRAIVRHRARPTANELILKNRRGVGAEAIRVRIEEASALRILWVQIRMFATRIRLLSKSMSVGTYGGYTLCKLIAICTLIHLARYFEAIRLMLGGIPLR